MTTHWWNEWVDLHSAKRESQVLMTERATLEEKWVSHGHDWQLRGDLHRLTNTNTWLNTLQKGTFSDCSVSLLTWFVQELRYRWRCSMEWHHCWIFLNYIRIRNKINKYMSEERKKKPKKRNEKKLKVEMDGIPHMRTPNIQISDCEFQAPSKRDSGLIQLRKIK